MSDPSSSAFLALLARAYDHPDERAELRQDLGVMGSPLLPWEEKQATIAEFIETTIAASADDARPRLEVMLTDLGWRPSLMFERVQHALGIAERRDGLLATIVDTFPVAPLEGCVIREAYLRDEEAFRVVYPEEYVLAREQAERTSWRAVPDAEIDFAFSKNSVLLWLDEGSLSFYLPACLSYALREGGACAFYTFLHFAEMVHADARRRWTADQCHAIAGFMAYVIADNPGMITENRSNVESWLAALQS